MPSLLVHKHVHIGYKIIFSFDLNAIQPYY